MEELLKRLTNLFDRKVMLFAHNHGSIARPLAAQQTALYQDLIQAISNVLSKAPTGGHTNHGPTPFQNAILQSLLTFTQQNPATVLDLGEGGWLVTSRLPVLEDASVQEFRAFISDPKYSDRVSEEAEQFAATFIAAILVEAPIQEFAQRVVDSAATDRLAFNIGLARYSSAKTSFNHLKSVDLRFSKEVAAAQASLDNYAAEFERLRSDHRLQLDTLAAGAAELKENQTDIRDNINNDINNTELLMNEARLKFDTAIQSSREELQNLKMSIREEMELNTMRVLWKDRAEESQRSFGICVVILLLMSGAALATILIWGQNILNFVSPFNFRTILLNSSVAGSISQQLGRILLVSTPIVVFFWMMKIVVRMLIRSVLNMDDARQRQTIMDSYFLLTKEGKTDDRALPMMLWALFRQVPGHGSDGIEPPDFTEAINAGLKTGILPK